MRKDIPKPDSRPRYPDMSENPTGMEEKIMEQREYERGLVPLRVTPTLLLLVTPDRATEEYAEWYRVNRLFMKPMKRAADRCRSEKE